MNTQPRFEVCDSGDSSEEAEAQNNYIARLL